MQKRPAEDQRDQRATKKQKFEVGIMDQPQTRMEVNESVYLKDIWGVILKQTNLYDTIFIRASSKWLNKLCKEFRPFPKYHVLDQVKCMAYLIESGSISCLDYVKNILHFEWTSKQSLAAVHYGQVEVLKHLCENGCPFSESHALITCTVGKCSLDMIKYLLEIGYTWRVKDDPYDNFISDMATHGHLDCIKYAIQTGCTNKKVHYTPSMECLEFFVENQFDFKDTSRSLFGRQNLCEYAAARGNLPMLQYAHQNGAPFKDSAIEASKAGHLECLKYVIEHDEVKEYVPNLVTNIECLKYLLEKFGREEIEWRFDWQTVGQTNNAEYLQQIIESGISMPTGSALQALMSSAVSSREMMKLICKHVNVEKQSQEWEKAALHALCARLGILEGLKILFELNIPINPNINAEILIHNAMFSGNVDVLKFVWERFPNKEGFDIQQTLSRCSYTTPAVIDFLVEHGAKPTAEDLRSAATSEKLEIVAHMTRLGCQLNEVPRGMPDSLCIKYLREHSPTKPDN